MRHQALRVFLEGRHDGHVLCADLGEVEGPEAVRADGQVNGACGQKLHIVDGGAALPDRHVETGLLVEAEG